MIRDVDPPFVNEEDATRDPLYEEQLLEWIGLVVLDSSRVIQSDEVDSYLCRYAPPETYEPADDDTIRSDDLVHLKWHGFMPATYVRYLWLQLRTAMTEETTHWFSLTANTFERTSFTVLCHEPQSLMLWECD